MSSDDDRASSAGYTQDIKECPEQDVMNLRDWMKSDATRRRDLASAWVVPEPTRCVQCGVCSYHCPVEIDVRRHVWLGEPVKDSYCLTCGECVARCPRGLLRFEPAPLAEAAQANRKRG